MFERLPVHEKLDFITGAITAAGRDALGYKVSKKKNPRQLSKTLRDKIKEKNELAKQLRENLMDVDPEVQMKLVIMKLEIKTAFAVIKLRKITKIHSQILRENPNRKKFWQCCRHFRLFDWMICACQLDK